jgi:hypothetical protein
MPATRKCLHLMRVPHVGTTVQLPTFCRSRMASRHLGCSASGPGRSVVEVRRAWGASSSSSAQLHKLGLAGPGSLGSWGEERGIDRAWGVTALGEWGAAGSLGSALEERPPPLPAWGAAWSSAGERPPCDRGCLPRGRAPPCPLPRGPLAAIPPRPPRYWK